MHLLKNFVYPHSPLICLMGTVIILSTSTYVDLLPSPVSSYKKSKIHGKIIWYESLNDPV